MFKETETQPLGRIAIASEVTYGLNDEGVGLTMWLQFAEAGRRHCMDQTTSRQFIVDASLRSIADLENQPVIATVNLDTQSVSIRPFSHKRYAEQRRVDREASEG